jgi:hypothetical protein
MGTLFKVAYGFDVTWEQKEIVTGTQTTDYDNNSFKIMVLEENNNFKIALLFDDLNKVVEKYKKQN